MALPPALPARLVAARLTRLDAMLAALVFAAGLALYVRTLAPDLLLGDGAEFQTLARTLGMTHTTGYPIYLLVAHAFTWLPFGDVAYRVNLMSAVAGAAALALVYLAGRSLGGWRSAALLAAIGLAVCGIFWWHAIMAELYSAAAALVAAVLVLLLQWRATGDARLLFAAGLLGGLSLGVHSSVALAAPAIALYLVLAAARRRDWAAAAGGALLGLALTLGAFLFIDALDAPISYYNLSLRPSLSVWGLAAHGFTTPLERLNFLFTGRQFHGVMFTTAWPGVMENAGKYWLFLAAGWGRNSIALMVLGLVLPLLPRRAPGQAGWREVALLFAAWLTMFVFIVNYDIGDIFVFYIATYVPLALLGALGLASLLEGARWFVTRAFGAAYAIPGAEVVGALLLLLLFRPAGAVVGSSWTAGRITFLDATPFANYPYPVRAPHEPRRQARRVIARVEGDALLLADWDVVFPLAYVANVEQRRTGITLVEWSAAHRLSESLRAVIDAGLARRPVYITRIPPDWPDQYTFTPVLDDPPLFRVTPRVTPPAAN